MTASIAALFRYPIKGFAPQQQDSAQLNVAKAFPGDRLFAIEDGPSGFDPAAPGFVSKQNFAVLAKYAKVAMATTIYDEATGVLTATAQGQPDFCEAINTQAGKSAFCTWLAGLLAGETDAPLKMLDGLGHRFLDHPKGHVSVLNMASVRDLEQRLGRPVNPMRFRANIHVEGWPAWAELDWAERYLRLGDAQVIGFKPIVRCAATEVDPSTANRDIEMTTLLFNLYGHMHMGLYVQVTSAGAVTVVGEANLLED